MALICCAILLFPTSPAMAQGCPELLGWWPHGPAEGVAVSGTTAYVADYGSGLRVIDVSDQSAPASVDGGLLVLADDRGGVAVFDDCRDVIFGDGFEEFETAAWSNVVP